MAVYTDAFTDDLGTALPDHDANWVSIKTSSDMDIGPSNAARGVSTNGAYVWNQAFGSKHYSKATYVDIDAGAGVAGVCIRGASGGNFFYCTNNDADALWNGECVADSYTDWDVGGLTARTNGEIIELAVDATTESTIHFKVGGSIIKTYTDKDALSGGKAGVAHYGDKTGVDDWEGGDIVTAASVTLDCASLAATAIPLANVNAPISRLLDTPALTLFGIPISVSSPAGGLTVVLETA